MIAVVNGLVSTGWILIWLVGVIVGVFLILRGRSVAGALIGLGSAGGLLMRLLPWAFGLVMPSLAALMGIELAYGLQRVVYGCGDALVLALLIVGAAVQRPPPPPPAD